MFFKIHMFFIKHEDRFMYSFIITLALAIVIGMSMDKGFDIFMIFGAGVISVVFYIVLRFFIYIVLSVLKFLNRYIFRLDINSKEYEEEARIKEDELYEKERREDIERQKELAFRQSLTSEEKVFLEKEKEAYRKRSVESDNKFQKEKERREANKSGIQKALDKNPILTGAAIGLAIDKGADIKKAIDKVNKS